MMRNGAGAGRPSTACDRCKLHKVRCSRDLPSCRRCLRSGHCCAYGTAKRYGQHEELPPSNTPARQWRTLDARREIQEPARPFHTTSDYLGIPEHVVSSLIDVYFSHVYNASLLLHKERFLADRAAGSCPVHIILSVCAFGSVFYLDAKDQRPFIDHGFAQEWAERAGKLALGEVETPRDENIVTFANLMLFWYTQGSWRRSYILKGNAMQTAHILNLINSSNSRRENMDAEILRRRFWACYLINCHSSDVMFAISPAQKLSGLPLPWPEGDFNASSPPSESISFGSSASNGGTYCELIKIMTLWASVNSLITNTESDFDAKIPSMHGLDRKLNEWKSRLPETLIVDINSLSRLPRPEQTKIILIHIAYHQALCALHASIVPLFSWEGGGKQPSQVAQQVSAQVAYEHACSISEILENVLSRGASVSDLSSFIGYAAYCSYAIQIPFKSCQNITVRDRTARNLLSNMGVIHGMARYWKSIELLDNYARYLSGMHSRNPLKLEDEPKRLPPYQLGGFRITAAQARAAILSFNGILWKDDGYSVQGDEVRDLGIGEGSVPLSEVQPDPAEATGHEGQALPTPGTDLCDNPRPGSDMYTQQVNSMLPENDEFPDMFQPLLDASAMFESMPESLDFINAFSTGFPNSSWQP